MTGCGVLNCSNRSSKLMKLFLVPKFSKQTHGVALTFQEKTTNKQCIAWIKALNRCEISKNVRVCSHHFSSGRPANWYDIHHPDWFPHIKMGYEFNAITLEYLREPELPQVNSAAQENILPQQNQGSVSFESNDYEELKICENDTIDEQQEFLRNMTNKTRKSSSEVPDHIEKDLNQIMQELTDNHKRISVAHKELEESQKSDVGTQTFETGIFYAKMQAIIDEQKRVIVDLKEKLSKYEHHESVYENDESRSLYYTGIPFLVLHTIFKFLEPAFKKHGNRKMGVFQSIVLTLMRLRLGLSFVDLGYRFNVSEHTASRVFHSTLDVMYANLKQLIIWPDRDDIKKTMPKQYIEKLGHDKLVCIIDCFEVFVQRPGEPMCNCQMWSHYKHHQTIKFLIAITPQGTVSFVSKAYVGRSSDNFVTKDSGFLDLLLPGDYVAADRGFTVETELEMLNATLLIPTFRKGQNQLLPRHLEATRQLASYRIHIERIIGLVKNKFRFFSMCLPMTTLYKETNDVAVVDQMMTVCCALINLCPPIVFNERENDDIFR